jgi:hypothetical protein
MEWILIMVLLSNGPHHASDTSSSIRHIEFNNRTSCLEASSKIEREIFNISNKRRNNNSIITMCVEKGK